MNKESMANDFWCGIDSNDPRHIRKTYMMLVSSGSLNNLIGIPPWPKIKKFLVRCWREAFLHPKDTNVAIGLNGYEAALDFCPFLANGNGIKGYDEKGRHYLIQMLHDVYENGDNDSRLCIETAIVEGFSDSDLKYWRKCN